MWLSRMGLVALFALFTTRRVSLSSPRKPYASLLFGMCLGYEDLNDHDQLRADPMLAVAVGKADPLGSNRLREEDRGKALAGKSAEIDKYKKILMPSSPRWMAVRLRKRWSRSNVSWSFKI